MATGIRRGEPSLSQYRPGGSTNQDIGMIATRYSQHRTNVALDAAVEDAQMAYEAYSPRLAAWNKSALSLQKQYETAAGSYDKGSPIYKNYVRTQKAWLPYKQGWEDAKAQKTGKYFKDPVTGVWFTAFPKEMRDAWWKQYGGAYKQARAAFGVAEASYEQAANAAQRLYSRYTGVSQRIAQQGRQAKRAYSMYEKALAKRNANFYPV